MTSGRTRPSLMRHLQKVAKLFIYDGKLKNLYLHGLIVLRGTNSELFL